MIKQIVEIVLFWIFYGVVSATIVINAIRVFTMARPKHS